MRLKIISYGLMLAFLVFLLKVLEYRYLIRELSIEFYAGVIAVLFVILGAWIGSRLTSRKVIVAPRLEFKIDEAQLKQTGISKREFEVLELISKGDSNQEIAEKLFVSTSTVKTHAANLFVKLDAKRRTQAIQKAKALNLIP